MAIVNATRHFTLMEKFTLWPDHFSITASIFVLLCFDSLSSNNKLTLILTCLLGHWGLRPCHVLSVTQVMSILNLNGRWKFTVYREKNTNACLLEFCRIEDAAVVVVDLLWNLSCQQSKQIARFTCWSRTTICFCFNFLFQISRIWIFFFFSFWQI